MKKINLLMILGLIMIGCHFDPVVEGTTTLPNIMFTEPSSSNVPTDSGSNLTENVITSTSEVEITSIIESTSTLTTLDTSDITSSSNESTVADTTNDTLISSNESTSAFSECGNNILETGEDCDDGIRGSENCNSDCTFTLCRDGKLNAFAEECDDGNNIDSDNCSNECMKSRFVFLTSDYIGLNDFGGIIVADTYCQNDANKFGIPGTYKAWLSDDNPQNDPYVRFNSLNFKGWWLLPSNPPIPIAKGWDGLQGELSNQINITSPGNKDIQTVRVWTATKADGKKANTSTCNSWMSLIDIGTITGNPQEISLGKWTYYGGVNCSGNDGGGKLYCFQVG